MVFFLDIRSYRENITHKKIGIFGGKEKKMEKYWVRTHDDQQKMIQNMLQIRVRDVPMDESNI